MKSVARVAAFPAISIVLDSFGGLTSVCGIQTGISKGQTVLKEHPFISASHADNPQLAQMIVENPRQFASHAMTLYGSSFNASERMELLESEMNELDASYQVALKIVNSNAFALPQDVTAVFKFASFFNHSCDPNLDTLRSSDSVEMVAKREIASGEPLTINYIGSAILLDHVSRNNMLSQGWQFVCQCSRCQHEMMMGHYADQHYSMSELNAFSAIHQILNGNTNISFNTLTDIKKTYDSWKYLIGADLARKATALVAELESTCFN
jgi:hypothetical protein